MVSLRALAPSLTRITVAAAVGAALHIGQGNQDLIDAKAVEFSRAALAQTDVEGEVITCEGPKDNAPAFMRREKVRNRQTTARAGCFQVLPDDGYYFKVATDEHSIARAI